MGQRLVITAVKNGEDVAALYQHWSGYTSDAIRTLRSIVTNLHELKSLKAGEWEHRQFDNPFILACTAFEMISEYSHTNRIEHPGLTLDDLISATKKYPDKIFHYAIDRNVGIIGMPPDGVDRLNSLGEAFAAIDLDSEEITFHVWEITDLTDVSYENIEELSYVMEAYNISGDDLKELPIVEINPLENLSIDILEQYNEIAKNSLYNLVISKKDKVSYLIQQIR